MKENFFSVKVKSKTSDELREICGLDRTYAEDFILAALWELEKRNELPPELIHRLTELDTKNEKLKKEAEYKDHLVPPDLPKNIKLAAYSLYLVFATEIFGFIILDRITWVNLNETALPGSLITLVTGFFIHAGKLWARVVFYVVFSVSTLFFMLSISHTDAIDVVQQFLIIVALFLLLSKESKTWYKKKI